MKKISVIFLFVIALFIVTACSDKKNEFDVYVNDVGYNIGDELFVDVSLSTTDTDIVACPILRIYKENEEDISKISSSINFTTDNVEFINLYGTNFSETLEVDNFMFEAMLTNYGEEINLINETIIERVKIKLNEKGKYKIILDENINNEECKIYNDSLTMNITKNEDI